MSDQHEHESPHQRAASDGVDERVAPIELFFDLVFVFALTQVTRLFEEDLSWTGIVRGLAVLAVLWWAWTGYVWLTNTIRPDDVTARVALLAAMAAMLIAGCAVPQAFGAWSLVFGAAYLAVRVLHVLVYLLVTRSDPRQFHAVLMLTPSMLLGGTLVLIAGFLDAGVPRALLWAAAIAVDFGGAVLTVGKGEGWQISPGHFAERHGLVVIIALGESVIAIGLTVTAAGLTAIAITSALLALVVVAGLWWLYFDVVALVAERRLTAETGPSRARMARDSYSFLHYPLIAGIVLFALGVHETLLHADEPLPTIPRAALLGGVALYLFAHVGFRLRNTRSWSVDRTALGVVLVAAIPVLVDVDAVVVLAILTGAVVATVVYETVRFRSARHEIREHDAGADWIKQS